MTFEMRSLAFARFESQRQVRRAERRTEADVSVNIRSPFFAVFRILSYSLRFPFSLRPLSWTLARMAKGFVDTNRHLGAGGPLAPTVSLPTVAPLQPEADPEFHWGRRQILSLIAKVEDFFEDFYDGTKKKKMIWKAVAERMRAEGHNCTGAECDKKWRNLKGTYVKVLQKQIHGDTSYRFEYFDALHHILGKEIDPLGMREQAMSRGPEEELHGAADYHEITVDGNFVWAEAAVHLLLDLVLEHRALLGPAADFADEPRSRTRWARSASRWRGASASASGSTSRKDFGSTR
ncbi:hypothetical protein C7M84_022065 [Penaeus vannamei]|uniref:Myb/SANT-like DNA-binding domain-containing protein n=1 Tax=Penaeus vannamei TaxID=6689 RepID=A0A423U7M3_PENVA|nr:hypothetical protein C7M84_022065 [Penaeus vannamei]